MTVYFYSHFNEKLIAIVCNGILFLEYFVQCTKKLIGILNKLCGKAKWNLKDPELDWRTFWKAKKEEHLIASKMEIFGR